MQRENAEEDEAKSQMKNIRLGVRVLQQVNDVSIVAQCFKKKHLYVRAEQLFEYVSEAT